MLAEARHAPHCSSLINENSKGFLVELSGGLSTGVFRADSLDFPGGPLAKNPPFNAGDLGSIPGQGTKIPRAMGQLSLCAVTT